MLQDDCNRINELVQKLENKLIKEEPTGLHILHDKFEAQPGMEPSFYYDYD